MSPDTIGVLRHSRTKVHPFSVGHAVCRMPYVCMTRGVESAATIGDQWSPDTGEERIHNCDPVLSQETRTRKAFRFIGCVREEVNMEDDRQKLTSSHLTVRLCVVSRRMRASWRSLKRHIKVSIRFRIGRSVLFMLSICTRND